MSNKSNIGTVLGRLENAQTKIPLKIREAFNADQYLPELRRIALSTLEAAANSEADRLAIPILMGHIQSDQKALHMMFSMDGLPWTSIGATFEPGSILKETTFQKIVAWVAEHKHKTEIDKRKDGSFISDERIAQRIIYLLQTDGATQESFFRTDEHGRGALNPDGLAQVIGLTMLPNARLDVMLRAVLAAWREYFREVLPRLVGAKIRECF